MLRLLLSSTKLQSNGHVHLTQSQSSLFLLRIQEILLDMVIRPINDPGMYISSVFLIRKDRELSYAGKLFLEEIGVLKLIILTYYLCNI